MTNLALAGFFGVFAVLTGYGFVSQRRRLGSMADTETTPAGQVREGTVELKGTVRARETVRDPMHGEESVLVEWRVEEREERTDPEGGAETVDHEIASGRREAVFEVADESGSVRVDPDGATLKVDSGNRTRESFASHDTTELTALKTAVDGDQGGTDREGVRVQADGVDSSLVHTADDRRSYTHELLRPGDDVYVLGNATQGVDGPIVGKEGFAGEFLLSNMSEEDLAATLGTNQWILGLIAAGATIAAGYFLLLG